MNSQNKTKNMSTYESYIVCIILVISSFFVIYTSVEGFIRVKILKTHSLTNATIINSYKPKMSSFKAKNKNFATFEYMVDNETYVHTEYLLNSYLRFKTDQKVQIYYNNMDINDAKIYRIDYTVLIISIILIIVTIMIIYKGSSV